MNKYRNTSLFLRDVSASTYVGLLFAVYTLILLLVTTPNATNWQYADPVLKIFPEAVTLWGIPSLSLLLFALWQRWYPIERQEMLSSGLMALAAAAIAVFALFALRMSVGEQLPAFIPSEESAKPGALLGMSAGLVEELVMRLMLTPIIFIVLRRWIGFHWSALSTIFITAIFFALWHEVGLTEEAFNAGHFLTRIMVPGVIMGLITFYVSPIFLVSLHCTIHIMLPLLFV